MDNINKKASSHFTLNMSAKRNDNSLYAEGWIVTTDNGESVTIARHDITAGLLQRKLSRRLCSSDGTGGDSPLVGGAGRADPGTSTLRIWMFVWKITDDSILLPDVLQAYNMAVDLKHCVLQLGKEAVSLPRPETRP
jgi:hypothetical protein